MGKINITENVLERLITECVSEVISENATFKKNITENKDNEKIVLTEEELAQIIEESALGILNEGKITGTAKALKGIGRGLKPAIQRSGQRFNNWGKSFGKTKAYRGQLVKGKPFNVKMTDGRTVECMVGKDGKFFFRDASTANKWQAVGPKDKEFKAIQQSIRNRQRYMAASQATRNGGIRNIAAPLAVGGAAVGGYYAGKRNGGNGDGNTGNDNGGDIISGGGNGNGPMPGNEQQIEYPWSNIEPVFDKPVTKNPQPQTNVEDTGTTQPQTTNTGADKEAMKNALSDLSSTAAGKIVNDKIAASMPQVPVQDKIGVPHAQARSTVNNANIARRQARGQSPERIGNAAIRQQNRTLKNQAKINGTK